MTEEERKQWKKRNIADARADVEAAKDALVEAMETEAPRYRTDYVELKPGDKGYEEAEHEMILVRGPSFSLPVSAFK